MRRFRCDRLSRCALVLGLLAGLGCRPAAPEPAPPQPEPQVAPRPTIDGEALRESVAWLSRDELQGRFTFDPQIEEAAEWLAEQHRQFGLQPAPGADGMRVAYQLRTGVDAAAEGQSLTVRLEGTARAVPAEDFVPRAEGRAGSARGEAVFVGYAARSREGAEGEPYDDLAGIELAGKVAVLLEGVPAPLPDDGERDASEPDAAPPKFAPREHGLRAKLLRLAEAGAVAAVVIRGPHSFADAAAREADAIEGVFGAAGPRLRAVVRQPAPIPALQLRWKSAQANLPFGKASLTQLQAAIDAEHQPRSRALGVELELSAAFDETRTEVPNVVAMIPGRRDEIVVLGAHFDHIGNAETGLCQTVVREQASDSICNGADDNASGTALLLEVARAIQASGIEPERSLVFAHFSGEELGLLGSQALAADAPFDMDAVVAMINLDMIGRLGPAGLAIGGVSTSADWMPLLDELGSYGMPILYEGSTTTRSDHAHWFRRQTPVLFFFTGLHEDYHQAGDELDGVNFEGLASIGQLVGDLVYELAQGRPIAWTPSQLPNGGIGRGLPGSDPATVIKRSAELEAIQQGEAAQ